MMTGATIGFYLLGLVAIIASLRVITRSNPVHALLNMIVSLLAVAGVFFALSAPFAGALEVIVYAGAIMVLFVFVVMMLNLGKQNILEEKSWMMSSAWAVPTGLAFIIGLVVVSMISREHTGYGLPQAWIGVQPVSAKMIGSKLFTEYLLLVEIAGYLLLAGLVAAYHLARRALDDEIADNNNKVEQFTDNRLINNDQGTAIRPRHVQEEKA